MPLQIRHRVRAEVHQRDQNVGIAWCEGVVGAVVVVLPAAAVLYPSYRKPGELSMPLGQERTIRRVTGAASHPASSAPLANAAVKDERGDTDRPLA